MSAIVAVLYLICLLALPTFAIFVLLRGQNRQISALFAWVSLTLWIWVATLFAFNLPIGLSASLILGRVNFAAIAPAVLLGYTFVMAIAGKPIRFTWVLWLETVLLTLASMFSPWIDAQELIQHGVHVTHYGAAFPFYVIHVVCFVSTMLWVTFRPESRTPVPIKRQLRIVGLGILATSAIALVTNVLLPYSFGDFAWIHIGAVSVVLFLAGTAGAIALAGLFEIHVLIRAAFIYGSLIALAVEVYQLAVDSLTKLLPITNPQERSLAATIFVLVLNSLTVEPVRKWLTRYVERIQRRSAKRQFDRN